MIVTHINRRTTNTPCISKPCMENGQYYKPLLGNGWFILQPNPVPSSLSINCHMIPHLSPKVHYNYILFVVCPRLFVFYEQSCSHRTARSITVTHSPYVENQCILENIHRQDLTFSFYLYYIDYSFNKVLILPLSPSTVV